MMHRTFGSLAIPALALLSGVSALSVDFTDQSSISAAAKILADGALSYYDGPIPGLVPAPYYWWESGALWDSMINYWAVTGDASYNSIVGEALLFQRGPDNNYMPANQTITEGNDDQAMWALAAMSAAESNLPVPSTSNTTWLELAVNVFNDQTARWDTSTCGGGLRWQIYAFNAGYDYKNSISAGYFMQLAARLALYTGNQTYADWANMAYTWSEDIGLISSVTYAVYDGTDTTTNCSAINRLQWTANLGTFLYGSAVMYNFTNASPTWYTRTLGLYNASSVFFTNTSIMQEVTCETQNTCDVDQRAFKALFSHWMGATTVVAPFTFEDILLKLGPSAQAAAAACSGGATGTACGEKWTIGGYDGNTGLGEELAALEVILAVLRAMEGGVRAANSTVGTGNTTAGNTTEPVVTSTSSMIASTTSLGAANSTYATRTASATLAVYTGAAARIDSHWAWTGCVAAAALLFYTL